MLHALFIINYVLAFITVLNISDDKNWYSLMTYVSLDMTEDEKKEHFDNIELYRKVFVTLLFIPYFSLIFTIIQIIKYKQ